VTVQASPSLIPAEAAKILDALGATWNVHRLYPNPADQPAFHRAVETLRDAVTHEVAFDVVSNGFQSDGEDIPTRRDGVERLARALFVHDIASLKIAAPPTPGEIVAFMDVLSRDKSGVSAGGGFHAAMGSSGITSIVVRQRRLLVDEEETAKMNRDESVREVLEAGSDPEQYAASLIAEAGGDPAAVAERFHSVYVQTLGRIEERDLTGREALVMGFVETFFFLPEDFRPAVLQAFLPGAGEEAEQMFLDQFSGIELAGLAPKLSPQGFTMLLEYASVTEDGPDARPEELLRLLDSARDVEQARKTVARQVAEKLETFDHSADPVGEAFRKIKSQVQDIPDPQRVAREVLAGLVECEARPHRFRRVLRIWTGRIVAAVRSGDFADANAWIDAVMSDPKYPVEREEQVSQALVKLATPALIDDLLQAFSERSVAADTLLLIRAWGPAVTEHLVERLGDEENPAYRRILIDMLAETARSNPRPLATHLTDSRWYVVRNLAIALGRTGRSQAAGPLRSLLQHDDYRVRIEALRALVPVARSDAVGVLLEALRDSHERVRQAALTLLRNSEEPAVEQGLIEALDDSALALAEKVRLIEILSTRQGDTARAALERLAASKALRASSRELRDAARAALRSHP
jgi:HEAT repeat protein